MSNEQLEDKKLRGNVTRCGSLLSETSEEQIHDDDSPPMRYRRKSFYSKSYNPEELDDSEIQIVPKTVDVKLKLESMIKDNVLFRSLEPEQRATLVDATVETTVYADEVLIKEGDDDYGFYLIDSGEFDIMANGGQKCVKTLVSGTFGELSLIHNQPSEFTVKSKTEGKVYVLNRNDFRKIVTKTTYEIRKTLEELINKVPMLQNLPELDKLKVADVLELINFADGDAIVKEGENPDGMFLVVRGSVRLTKKGNEDSIVETGGYFGELPPSTPAPGHPAYACGPTKLAHLKSAAFERLMGPCLTVLKKYPSNSRKTVSPSGKTAENA